MFSQQSVADGAAVREDVDVEGDMEPDVYVILDVHRGRYIVAGDGG